MTESKGFGCYSPLRKRPAMPPSEFFRRYRRNDQQSKSMKPKDLAELCYGHYDGTNRSQMKKKSDRDPQDVAMIRLSLPQPFWQNHNNNNPLKSSTERNSPEHLYRTPQNNNRNNRTGSCLLPSLTKRSETSATDERGGKNSKTTSTSMLLQNKGQMVMKT